MGMTKGKYWGFLAAPMFLILPRLSHMAMSLFLVRRQPRLACLMPLTCVDGLIVCNAGSVTCEQTLLRSDEGMGTGMPLCYNFQFGKRGGISEDCYRQQSDRCVCVCVCVCVWASCGQLFVVPWTVAHLVPLSIGFLRQEYWSRVPFPTPGYLPDPGIEPASLALADRFFTTSPT